VSPHPPAGTDDPLPRPGEPVRVRFAKWDGTPHWAFDMVSLGRDRHGVWVGCPAGTIVARPGRSIPASADFVCCHPIGTDPASAGWVATFNAPHGDSSDSEVYVDIATPSVWSRAQDGVAEVRMVDVDLDVIRRFDGTVLIDDEDEFADHRESLGYPDEVVDAAQLACDAVASAVTARREPFGVDGPGWLSRFRAGLGDR